VFLNARKVDADTMMCQTECHLSNNEEHFHFGGKHSLRDDNYRAMAVLRF